MDIVVIGAGAWGTAMAVYLAKLDHSVTLVARKAAAASAMINSGENHANLPGIPLGRVRVVGPENIPARADVVLMGIPSHAIAEAAASAKISAPVWMSLAKGVRLDSLTTPCEAMEKVLPAGSIVACLSGPSHAGSVAAGLPCAMVLSGNPVDLLAPLQEAFSSAQLRVYLSSDRRGAELGGALKNVFAVAAGVCDGLEMGDNAKAGLLTRAVAEMARIGTVLGGKTETFFGLTGVGDLMATSYGLWSRNRQLGERVCIGEDPAKLVEEELTAEGYRASLALRALIRRKGVESPILEEVAAILHDGRSPKESMNRLMTRPLKAE